MSILAPISFAAASHGIPELAASLLVVVLHVWQGLSFREIADITGDNSATVASRYRAALRIFRQQLEDELNPPS